MFRLAVYKHYFSFFSPPILHVFPTPSQLSLLGVAACFSFLTACKPSSASPSQNLPLSLELMEHFGVAHPEQVICFEVEAKLDPASTKVLDSEGNPVVSQVLRDGRIALPGDLPAESTRRWEVVQGAPLTTSDLSFSEHKEHYEIANRYTAIRVPKAIDPGTGEVPAPVGGFRLADGSWTATGPTPLELSSGESVSSMQVEVIDQGPLITTLRVRYEIERAGRSNDDKTSEDKPGFYQCTISMHAGQQAILLEEESDCSVKYSLVLNGFDADQARYRGHRSGRPEHGSLPDGSPYVHAHLRPPMDAFFDLPFDRDHISGSGTSLARDTGAEKGSIARMSRWDRWSVDTGWYWQIYNKEAGPDSNLIGIFTGAASRLINPLHSGAGIFTKAPTEEHPRQVGITMVIAQPPADDSPHVRFGWNIMVGTQADLAPFDEFQPISQLGNRMIGFNLTKIASWKLLDYPDPPQGYGGIYMDREAVEDVKRRIQESNLNPGEFYHWIITQEPISRPLFAMWHEEGNEKLNEQVDAVMADARTFLQPLVNEDGINTLGVGYWHGGLLAFRNSTAIDQLLADERTTPEQRKQIQAAAAAFAYILWDNDFVPMENHKGIPLGTANMPLQQSGYRWFFALLLANHPDFQERAAKSYSGAMWAANVAINEHGASISCPHYIAPATTPTINSLMQIQQAGLGDAFREEPRIRDFAEFYLQLLTPPEPRLREDARSIVMFGHGTPFQSSPLYGQLGTAFRDADPDFSAQLMQAWDENARSHGFFFGSTTVMIDDRLPRKEFTLNSAHFDGYFTVLRSGWGTPDETAVWLINGEFYQDHRFPDRCSLVAYALANPLTTQWISYSSPTPGSQYSRPMVVLENMINFPWDQDSPLVTSGDPGVWRNSRKMAFAEFEEGTYAQARSDFEGTLWLRGVTLIHANPSLPILAIRDVFAGSSIAIPKIMSLPLEAEGPVETPAGTISPPERFHPWRAAPGSSPEYLPSATPPMELAPGVNRFRFTGNFEIDFDVIVVSDQSQQALLGNWGIESGPQKQKQHFLRVRGPGPFLSVLLPYRKGERPESYDVTMDNGDVLISAEGITTRLRSNGYDITRNGETVSRSW